MTHVFPGTMRLTPVSRWPTQLAAATVDEVLAWPLPSPAGEGRAVPPRASVIVVTYNNLVFNRLCLESVILNTSGPAYELVVVDNGSTDGTAEYLEGLAALHPAVRVLRNSENRGFGPAANQGLAAARGDVLVLLNNDTIVTPGWLGRFSPYLDDPAMGLIGAVTNRAANEAQVETAYETYGELLAFADSRARTHAGRTFPLTRLVMFCAAMRRETYRRIGGFDERFAVALFEDDDYVMRVRQAALEIACAEDVFVHHFGQASIGHLGPSREYGALFDANRRRFEEKWGTAWQAHHLRPNESYAALVDRIRRAAASTIPAGSTVMVVSKGDDALLDLPGCAGSHFPRRPDGGYTGYHPADGDEAVASLDAERAAGAGFLLIPSPMFWWLDHYQTFRRHLETSGRLLLHEAQTCMIFALKEGRR